MCNLHQIEHIHSLRGFRDLNKYHYYPHIIFTYRWNSFIILGNMDSNYTFFTCIPKLVLSSLMWSIYYHQPVIRFHILSIISGFSFWKLLDCYCTIRNVNVWKIWWWILCKKCRIHFLNTILTKIKWSWSFLLEWEMDAFSLKVNRLWNLHFQYRIHKGFYFLFFLFLDNFM